LHLDGGRDVFWRRDFFYVERNESVREGGWRQAVAFVPPEPWKRVLDLGSSF